MDEIGVVVRDKARLVTKRYNQEEGIAFDETFILIARLEVIRMLLAYVSCMNIKLYQMDVKSAFLNGIINEEVYVEQPLWFDSHEFLNHVYKQNKILYGLKQEPRAWYERLSTFLLDNEFTSVDTTLFTKRKNHDLLIIQIYVGDIIFGATNPSLCEEFAKLI